MRLRYFLLLCVIGVGCHTFIRTDPDAAEPPQAAAQQLWEQGQDAMRAGQPEQAIGLYEKSLAEDAERKQNHLSLAAAYLEKGDDRLACEHLGKFLQYHPEHRNARFYYAELLLKLGRHKEAHREFELAIANAQDEPERDLAHLAHCHGQLLEIGEALGDDYLVHLHRGIGIYVLAQRRAGLDDPAGELSTEALLCKAAAELAGARALRPAEARPNWYLYAVWRQLAQSPPARRALRAAGQAAPFSYLTPAEQRGLELALRGDAGDLSLAR